MSDDDRWDPTQYEKFRAERMQPFHDLLARVVPHDGMRVVDLGCGTGEQTAIVAERLPGSTVLGVDSSPAMLARAAPRASARVRFEEADIARFTQWSAQDLVFSNAALQWVPDHAHLVPRMLSAMKPGAQIAVQMPCNRAHPSHRIAHEVAQGERFRAQVGNADTAHHVEPAEWYAEQLWSHGLRDVRCDEHIYGHELRETAEVVEWTRGTLLTAYLAPLSADDARAFLDEYRARVLAEIGDRRPYLYTFRRLLISGTKRA